MARWDEEGGGQGREGLEWEEGEAGVGVEDVGCFGVDEVGCAEEGEGGGGFRWGGVGRLSGRAWRWEEDEVVDFGADFGWEEEEWEGVGRCRGGRAGVGISERGRRVSVRWRRSCLLLPLVVGNGDGIHKTCSPRRRHRN